MKGSNQTHSRAMKAFLKSPTFILFTLARLGASAMLLWALAPHPYNRRSFNYYALLKVVTSAVCLFGVYCATTWKRKEWAWVFGALIVLFNPLFNIPLGRPIWNAIDIVVAIFLFCSIFFFKPFSTR